MKTKIEHTGFGLIAWLESTRVCLPLKGVECRFEVRSGVAAVEVDQIYLQENARPLDCTYSFPLPAGAAVYRCEVDINGRVIRAIVEEKAAARKIYAEQKAQGHRAALVESERDNLFTLQLGNVQPGDMVIVRFCYLQTIERGAGEQRRLRIPVCPGVRYIPGEPLLRSPRGRGTADDTDQVPDASRISPPRMDQFHPDAAYCAITGTLPATDAAEDRLASPTHQTRAKLGAGGWQVELDERGAVPDRDFVLTWEPPVEQVFAPRAWGTRHDGFTYALVQLRAPRDVAVSEDFAQDYYFLVDRSGSMAGAKWEKTCVALTAFVRLLGERDRVWITLFESGYKDFAERPLPAHEVRDDRAFQKLVTMGTAGGTELAPAATHVLEQVRQHSKERRSVVVLITDGEIGNEAAVLGLFAQAPETTIFTFGIDTTVNDALLRALAAQHGGTCVLQTPRDDIAATVAGLADRLRRPVITDLRVAGGWVPGTKRLPALFGGETVDLVLRASEAGTAIAIEGRRADGKTESWSLPMTAVDSDAPRLLWARERIAAHEAAGEDAQALELAKAHNLICKSAAFVAWDEAERVKVAVEEVYQPSMEAAMGGGTVMRKRAGFACSQPLASVASKSFRHLLADEGTSADACAPAPASAPFEDIRAGSWGDDDSTDEDTFLSSHEDAAPSKPRKPAPARPGLLQKLRSVFTGGKHDFAEKEVAPGVSLPPAVADLLLAWKRAHEKDPASVAAFERLMGELRKHPAVAGATAEDTQKRRAEFVRLLNEFAHTHVANDQRVLLALELNKWASQGQ